MPSTNTVVLALIVAATTWTPLSPAGYRRNTGADSAAQAVGPPQRIISMIPAATEMLFDMGAADRLVGAGSFDRFPPEVARLPRVGGLLDPNVERILSLKPDLVVVYDTQVELRRQLDRAGIATFLYTHRGLDDVAATIRALGVRVGASDAEARARRIEQQLAAIAARVAGRTKPRTLLVFGREPGTLRRIEASGGYGFLHDLLLVAGGEDVLGDVKQQSVQVTTEALLARAPEVILEVRYGRALEQASLDVERRAWNALPSVPAVRTNRVYLLIGDEFVVPGPRVVLAAERFARALHPDAF
jgi:iron complex transport system substrate-binding protein